MADSPSQGKSFRTVIALIFRLETKTKPEKRRRESFQSDNYVTENGNSNNKRQGLTGTEVRTNDVNGTMMIVSNELKESEGYTFCTEDKMYERQR